MNLNDWLHHLEFRHKQEMQLGLERIRSAAQKLELLHPACPVITVAGTNGKGSTVRALETIYHHAGFTVGAFTSPHLIRYNERIRVNQKPIADEVLCQLFHTIDSTCIEWVITYFEMATLAALLYFKQSQVDVIILEVGIGGRLDATNIIDAELSIITTVDYDHQQTLGTTLDQIGFEKIGIARKDRPFIYADTNPPKVIMQQVKEIQTQAYYYNKDYSYVDYGDYWSFTGFAQQLPQLPKPTIQLKSAAAALAACLLLQDTLAISIESLTKSIPLISLPARLQLEQQGDIQILYDVAHNPQSAQLLASRIISLKKNKVHAVFSALKDKDIMGIISPLKDCVAAWYRHY